MINKPLKAVAAVCFGKATSLNSSSFNRVIGISRGNTSFICRSLAAVALQYSRSDAEHLLAALASRVR